MSQWEELRRGHLVGLWDNPQTSLSLSSLFCETGMEFLSGDTSHPTRGGTPQRHRGWFDAAAFLACYNPSLEQRNRSMFLEWAISIQIDIEQLTLEILALSNRFTPGVSVPGTWNLNVQREEGSYCRKYLRTLEHSGPKTRTSGWSQKDR